MNENEVNELITKAKKDDRLKIMNEKIDKMNLLLSRYTKEKRTILKLIILLNHLYYP